MASLITLRNSNAVGGCVINFPRLGATSERKTALECVLCMSIREYPKMVDGSLGP